MRTTVEVAYTDPALISPGNPDPPPSTSVDVWHVGSVRLYDSLQYGLTAWTLTASVFGDTNPLSPRLDLWNTSVPSGLLLEAGQRLLRLTDRPTAFRDPTGTLGPTGYVETDPATGRAWCYLRPYHFDYVVSGIGVDTRLVTDAVGSYVMH